MTGYSGYEDNAAELQGSVQDCAKPDTSKKNTFQTFVKANIHDDKLTVDLDALQSQGPLLYHLDNQNGCECGLKEARDKNANLVTAVVFPALEPHTGRLRINGTPVHFDSFIQNILVGNEQAKKRGEKFSWDVIAKKFASILDSSV